MFCPHSRNRLRHASRFATVFVAPPLVDASVGFGGQGDDGDAGCPGETS